MAVETKQESKTIGKGSITTGLTQTASRNMIKTLMFMQLYENCCVQFKKLEWFQHHNYLLYYTAAGLSGSLCGAVCYPFELIRVMKISFEPYMGKQNGFKILNLVRESPHITKKILR